MFVVMVLSTTVLSMSVYNVKQSAFDRPRVNAVVAAEAGLDQTFSSSHRRAHRRSRRRATVGFDQSIMFMREVRSS